MKGRQFEVIKAPFGLKSDLICSSHDENPDFYVFAGLILLFTILLTFRTSSFVESNN